MLALFVEAKNNQIQKITLFPSEKMHVEMSVLNPKIKRKMEKWLDLYLTKKSAQIELPLDFSCFSDFSKKVLKALQEIPFGQTQTYLQIAKQIGHVKAYRAVGNVCHNNPFPLIIPCHRVVAKGHLGGFAYGKEMKLKLLQFEQ